MSWQAWLAVSTAVLSSLTAYNAYSPMEIRMQVMQHVWTKMVHDKGDFRIQVFLSHIFSILGFSHT